MDDLSIGIFFFLFFSAQYALVYWRLNNLTRLFSQVIAVAKSSDIVLMVLDASKVSVFLAVVLLL
jgi:hypothetical protein